MISGHDVAFATTPIACSDIERFGFRCFRAGVDDWVEDARSEPRTSPERPAQAAAVWVALFAGSRARQTLPDLLTACRGWRPDLLVRESTEFAGCVAAERIGIPHVAVQVGAWRPQLQRLIAPALDRLRESVGLPLDTAQEMLHRHLLLSLVPPSFAEPRQPLPATARMLRYVPFDRDPSNAGSAPKWDGALAERPRVFATLGTAYNRTAGIAQMMLTALRDEPVNLLLALGPGLDPASFGSMPAHIQLESYVPQSLAFPACDSVISHGGFSTMLTALSFGLPQVMIPIAADQPDNARRCAALGAAQIVEPKDRTPEAIRAAVRAVLANASYRAAAKKLQAEMRAMPAPEHVASILEKLVPSPRQ
jgi:UDP:flavonoid glycosyltransferase YjiC (YdhE family)